MTAKSMSRISFERKRGVPRSDLLTSPRVMMSSRVSRLSRKWNDVDVGSPRWNGRGEALHDVPAVPMRVRVK